MSGPVDGPMNGPVDGPMSGLGVDHDWTCGWTYEWMDL